jgi:hypothetical protein
MDILRHGAQVEVLAPASLVSEVHRRLEMAAELYRRRQATSAMPPTKRESTS